MHYFQINPKYRQNTLLILCALLHGGVTCAFALTRLYTYKDSLLDMATWDQALWNIIHHGAPLCTTNPPFTPQNIFGFHFSPVVLLLLPFYALWPHVELLQIAQSLCFGFAGMVMFYALKAAGARQWEAWVGCALYWLNPFVLSAAIWDFHEIAFATLFIAIALWGLCAGRFTAMLLALLLLLLTKEHYGLSVAGFGFLWGLRRGDWRRTVALMTLGILTLMILLAVVIPAFHAGSHFMWAHSGTVADRYSWMSEPWPVKMKTFYTLMFERGGHNSPGIIYLFLLLMSGLMLPLAAPFYLTPASADILANLLASNPMPRGMGAYHSAAIIPVVLIAAYQGYRWFERISLPRKDLCICGMISLATTISVAGLVVPLSAWELSGITLSKDPATQQIQALVLERPVSAQSNIGVFFSQRAAIYPFPDGIEQSSAVILHLANPFSAAGWKYTDKPYGEPASQYFSHLRAFLKAPGWHVAYWQPPWLVMMRGKATKDERAMRADIAQHIDTLDLPFN